MAKTRLDWIATVMCEGGPVLAADVSHFAQWTGAAPFSLLRTAKPGAAANRMTTLHYWGQFTNRLPAPFAAEGGHVFVQHATEDQARAQLAELCRAAKAALPALEISEDEEQMHFLLPSADADEDEEEMWAELAPKSEYDASWQTHEGDDCWTHAFGKSGSGLFWELEGGGVAEVGVTAERNEIVLVRSWVDDDKDEANVRAHVDARRDNETDAGMLELPTGRLVAIWSPVAPFQLEGIANPEELAALGEGKKPARLDTDDMNGVGAVIQVKPGRWKASIAKTDDEAGGDDLPWSARWCRLTWQG